MIWDKIKNELPEKNAHLVSISIFITFVAYYFDGSFQFSSIYDAAWSLGMFVPSCFIVFCIIGGIYSAVDESKEKNILSSIKTSAISILIAFSFFKLAGW